MKSNNKLKYFLLAVVLILGIGFRLYKINNSLTEWFSWRQTDTAAVGRFLQRNNFNLLKPQYYDLSNIQSGIDNPQGLRFVEFPLYNAMFAYANRLVPALSLEVWARVITIVFSLIIIIALFAILESEFGLADAFFGSLFFAVSPYVVFYSRAILPDMPSTALAFLSVYFLYRYLKADWFSLLLGSVFMALALLIKPMVIFFVIPALFLLFKKSHANIQKIAGSLFFLLVSLLPVLLWRSYISHFPEGVPYSQWLFTSVNTQEGLQNIFFRPSFFRWIFFERISTLLMGGYLVFFLLFGLLLETKKNLKFHYVLALSAILYLLVFQGGNVQHEYYQIMITPALSVLIGVGVGNYFRLKKTGYLVTKIFITLIIFTASLLFSFYQVKGKYNESHNLVLVSDVVRSLTNKNDIIITDSTGDTTLLYLSDRRGYPAPYRELPELKAQGAKYFITQNLDYEQKLKDQYSLIFQNNQVLIFQL